MKKSLAILHKSGYNSYKFIHKQGFPLPSYSLLMQRLQNINIIPGIQTELIEIASSCLNEDIIHCSLQIDEMQIKPSINYDKGTKSFSGFISDEFNCENENSVASHFLVYMLRSLYSDNKLVTAYYLTGKSIDGTNFWKTTKQVISTIEENKKFKVHSVVTDMGPSNRTMWRAANIHSDRDSTTCFTVHPNDSQRSLFFLADPTHLIKNLRNLLLKNNIILPKSVTNCISGHYMSKNDPLLRSGQRGRLWYVWQRHNQTIFK